MRYHSRQRLVRFGRYLFVPETRLPLRKTILSMFQRDPRAGAFLGGDRVSGQDIRDQNGARCHARPKPIFQYD